MLSIECPSFTLPGTSSFALWISKARIRKLEKVLQQKATFFLPVALAFSKSQPTAGFGF